MSTREEFIVARLFGRSAESDLCCEIGHFSAIDGRDVRQRFKAVVCLDCPILQSVRGDISCRIELQTEADFREHIRRHIERGDRVPLKIGRALETVARFFGAP